MSQGEFRVVFLRCFPFFRVTGGEWLPCAGMSCRRYRD